jgi:ribosome-binding protein aMBF1 (putative translation factor)
MKTNTDTTVNTETSRMFTDSTDTAQSDIYRSLKTQCGNAGISISKLCKEARVNRSILERWKRSEPKSIKTYNALLEALERIRVRNNK